MTGQAREEEEEEEQDLTTLPSKEHLRRQQTRKRLAYQESTRTILNVTSPYSKCNRPLLDICPICS